MATQAKVIIKGQNELGNAVKSASSDLSKLTSTITKIGSTLKTAFAATAIISSIQKIGSACRTMLTEDFGEAERAYKQLAIALKDQESYDSVVANMDILAKKTLSANGDIEAMVAELAALGKSSDEINRISTAAVALSNVTGKDLNSSMTTLLNTYNGTTTQLKRLGIDLEGITREQLAQGAAVDVVIEKLGAYSDMMAEGNINQHLKNMSETWGDIKEKIGGIIAYNFGPMIANLDASFEEIGQKINSVTVYIGAVISNFPEVFRLVMRTLWEMVRKTFEWESIKTIFVTGIENIGIAASAMLKAVFVSIPSMVVSVVKGIVYWVSYIGANIKAVLLEAIESVINGAGEKIQGTWIGKLFGLGDKLATLDLGGAGLRKEADSLKDKADSAFEEIGPQMKNAISDAIEAAVKIVDNTTDAHSSIYGDIEKKFKNALDEIVASELEIIRKSSNASDQTLILEEIARSSATTASSSAGTEENTARTAENTEEKKSERLSSKISAFLTSRLGGLFSSSSMTGFLGVIMEDFTAGIGDVVDELMILVNIIAGATTPFGMLLTVVKGFVSVMEVALTTVFQPINDILSWIGQSLAGLLLPVLDQLHVAFALIANMLYAVFIPIFQSLQPVFQVIAAVMEALSPILILVAKAFTIVASPIQFVADLLSWLGAWITYCGHAVATFCYNLVHPFSKRSYGTSPGGFSSDAFTGLADRLAAIDNIAASDSTVSDSVSTGTAVSSASYAGSTHITINIYQQAPVVGDGGMRAFARMLKAEFLALNYYGVN